MRRLNFMIRLSALGASQKDICYNTLDGMHPSLFTPSVSSLANLCRQAINHICDARWPGHCSLSWANLITSCASSHSFSNMSFIFFSCVYLATSISFLYCFVQLGSYYLHIWNIQDKKKHKQEIWRDIFVFVCCERSMRQTACSVSSVTHLDCGGLMIIMTSHQKQTSDLRTLHCPRGHEKTKDPLI